MKFTNILALTCLISENLALKLTKFEIKNDESQFEQNYVNANYGVGSEADKKYFQDAMKRGPYVPNIKFPNDEDEYMDNYNKIVAEERKKKAERAAKEAASTGSADPSAEQAKPAAEAKPAEAGEAATVADAKKAVQPAELPGADLTAKPGANEPVAKAAKAKAAEKAPAAENAKK